MGRNRGREIAGSRISIDGRLPCESPVLIHRSLELGQLLLRGADLFRIVGGILEPPALKKLQRSRIDSTVDHGTAVMGQAIGPTPEMPLHP